MWPSTLLPQSSHAQGFDLADVAFNIFCATPEIAYWGFLVFRVASANLPRLQLRDCTLTGREDYIYIYIWHAAFV